MLKPSEFASPSVIELATMLGDILPPGAVNVVTGFGPDVGAALVSHPGIAKISFTGGGVAARRIMAAAAETLTPSLMELGGKSPMVVCADADLETAVQDALLGIFLANGEVCFASSRLLVHEDVYDAFLDRFVEVAAAIKVGHALDPETQLGPLVTAAHRDRVVAHIEQAKAEGVELRLGGERLDLPGELANGNFVAPTIFADPEGRGTITREEVFGPVAVVERWRDEEDAIARANATEYGLGAGVWTTTSPARTGSHAAWMPAWSGSTSGSTRLRDRRWAASRRAASAGSSRPRRCTSTARRRRSTSGSPASAPRSGASSVVSVDADQRMVRGRGCRRSSMPTCITCSR